MIVVAGEALVDLLIRSDGSVAAVLGGAPFNTARTAGRLGAPVAFAGALSDDRFGALLAERLRSDGVATDLVRRVPLPTTLAAAELDDSGSASYRFYVAATSAPALDQVDVPAEATVFFTGGLALVLEPMASAIVAALEHVDAGVTVMVDVNCRPRVIADGAAYRRRLDDVFRRADVVKVSDDDLAYLEPERPAGDSARSLLDRGARAVLLTSGAGAVHVLTTAESREVPVVPVDVVDTVGAGDSFGGAFLAWWVASRCVPADLAEPERLVRAVTAANLVAGLVCSRRGADPPWRHELPGDWSP